MASRSKVVMNGLMRRVAATAAWLRAFPTRSSAWTRWCVNRRRYRILDADELRATRTSDTVFIFGSGYSINDLTQEEARFFEQHDTFGFNFFWRQDVVRVDYHLAREMAYDDLDRSKWLPQLQEYAAGIAGSPHYRNTILLLQAGFRAINPNQAIGHRILPEDRRIFFFHNDPGRETLARSFDEAIPHRHGTLEDCVNVCFLTGWRTIVLVGVDLYDRRYFWLGPDETSPGDVIRNASWSDVHHTARGGGVVARMDYYRQQLKRAGVELFVYNPRSLLADVLPVYRMPLRPAPDGQ